MIADDENPTVRWQSIRDWYDEFARTKGWEFLRPMVELADWVSQQSWADRLFPGTSLHWLCVSLERGYRPDSPCIACCAGRDGLFICKLWSKSNQLEMRRFPIDEAHTAFWNFIRRLENVA